MVFAAVFGLEVLRGEAGVAVTWRVLDRVRFGKDGIGWKDIFEGKRKGGAAYISRCRH